MILNENGCVPLTLTIWVHTTFVVNIIVEVEASNVSHNLSFVKCFLASFSCRPKVDDARQVEDWLLWLLPNDERPRALWSTGQTIWKAPNLMAELIGYRAARQPISWSVSNISRPFTVLCLPGQARPSRRRDFLHSASLVFHEMSLFSGEMWFGSRPFSILYM